MLNTAMGRLLLEMDMDMFQLPMADMLQLPMSDMSLSAMDMTFFNMDMDMHLPERSMADKLLPTRGYAPLNLSSSTMSWI